MNQQIQIIMHDHAELAMRLAGKDKLETEQIVAGALLYAMTLTLNTYGPEIGARFIDDARTLTDETFGQQHSRKN